jgi:hypothetical protein
VEFVAAPKTEADPELMFFSGKIIVDAYYCFKLFVIIIKPLGKSQGVGIKN